MIELITSHRDVVCIQANNLLEKYVVTHDDMFSYILESHLFPTSPCFSTIFIQKSSNSSRLKFECIAF